MSSCVRSEWNSDSASAARRAVVMASRLPCDRYTTSAIESHRSLGKPAHACEKAAADEPSAPTTPPALAAAAVAAVSCEGDVAVPKRPLLLLVAVAVAAAAAAVPGLIDAATS